MQILAYDFEVFSKSISPKTGQAWWMILIKDVETGKGKVIIDDVDELRRYYEEYKDAIWCGYNSRQYDQFILKGLLLGMDAGYVNDRLINDGIKGHNIVKGYKVPFNNYDVTTGFHSLKQLEAFSGMMIKESSVPFTLDRPLTEEEIKETVRYCLHDVNATIMVLNKRKSEFESHLGLINMFNLGMGYFTKTKAQLTAHILGAKKRENTHDEFDFIYPDTLKLDKYQYVKDWFDTVNSQNDENGKKNELVTNVSGMETAFLLGGVHGAIPNYHEEGLLVSCDVASLYPALILEYGLMTRAVESDVKFREIRDTRIKYKKAKNPLQAPLKIAINSVYGCFGDQYNPLCDFRMMRSVCVAGQLLLTDLIEKIEHLCEPFNLNTDGIFMKVKDEETLDEIKKIAKEWEQRTRLELEWEKYTKVHQKDVNNYIIVDEEGKYKGKGAYVKDLSDLDYDLPIVNKAIVQYFVNDTPIEETVNRCNELREFQKVVKLTSAYNNALYGCTFSKQKVLNATSGRMNTKTVWDGNGEVLSDKTFRVFASTLETDGGLFKMKTGKNPEKFANTPENCFIDNDNIIGKTIPDHLDKQYYIELAQTRINQFLGISNRKPKKEKEPK